MKYPQFFAPEIKPFINDKLLPAKGFIFEINKELPENFHDSRKKGENDCYLCNLIREDSVKDLIANVNRNSIPFNARKKRRIILLSNDRLDINIFNIIIMQFNSIQNHSIQNNII